VTTQKYIHSLVTGLLVWVILPTAIAVLAGNPDYPRFAAAGVVFLCVGRIAGVLLKPIPAALLLTLVTLFLCWVPLLLSAAGLLPSV